MWGKGQREIDISMESWNVNQIKDVKFKEKKDWKICFRQKTLYKLKWSMVPLTSSDITEWIIARIRYENEVR